MILVSDHDSSIAGNPRERALDDISLPVLIPESVVLSVDIPMIPAMRNQEGDSPFFQTFSSRIAVVCLVSDHSSGPGSWPSCALFGDSDFSKRLIKELDLSRRGRVGMNSERNTLAIDQYQALRSLSPLGFPDSRAPFFAGKKLASTKTSSQSRIPRWSRSERKARHMFLNTHSFSHFLSRRQQVDGWGYRSGKSFHLAPVLQTQRIPSNTKRSSALGRPPLGPRTCLGMRGSIFAHCASVNITSRTPIGPPPRSVLREKP